MRPVDIQGCGGNQVQRVAYNKMDLIRQINMSSMKVVKARFGNLVETERRLLLKALDCCNVLELLALREFSPARMRM